MSIRAAIAIGLLGLAAAACSATTESTATSASSTPTTTTATTSQKCADFAASTYIGADINSANRVEAFGWSHELWDEAGSPSWESGANGKTWVIGGVEKDPVKCAARFKVIAGLPVAPPASSTPAAPPAPPPGPLTTVSDGTYLVGTDMAAGSYKTAGGRGCYWARLKDDSGTNIIANNLSDGPARFTAKKGEFVEISGCTFTKV